MTQEEILAKIAEAIADGDEDEAVELVNKAFEMGLDPMTVLNKGAGVGMDKISEDYNNGDAFLPELVLAGDAMTAVNEVIFDQISKLALSLSVRPRATFMISARTFALLCWLATASKSMTWASMSPSRSSMTPLWSSTLTSLLCPPC